MISRSAPPIRWSRRWSSTARSSAPPPAPMPLDRSSRRNGSMRIGRSPVVPSKLSPLSANSRARVGFVLIVPSATPTRPKPAGGWPVAIFGPGVTRSKYDVFLAADENLKAGIATIGIDPVGHAYGPGTQSGVDLAVPPTTERFSGFGRAVDVEGDGVYGNRDGLGTKLQPAPVRQHRPARRAAPDRARQHGLGPRHRSGNRRRRGRNGRSSPHRHQLLRPESRRHLRHDAHGDRSFDHRRSPQRSRWSDSGDRPPVARLPVRRDGRARQSPAVAAQRRQQRVSRWPTGLHRVDTAVRRPAGDRAGAGRRAHPGDGRTDELDQPQRKPRVVRPAPEAATPDRAGTEEGDLPVRVRRPDRAQPDQRHRDAGRQPAKRDVLLPQRPHADRRLRSSRLPDRPPAHRSPARDRCRSPRS